MSSYLTVFLIWQVKSTPNNVTSRDTEGHVNKLFIQLRDEIDHSLDSISRSRDNVLGIPQPLRDNFPEGTFMIFWMTVLTWAIVMNLTIMSWMSLAKWSKY
jgi:hypothetical protein